MSRSDYSAELESGVLRITDLNIGGMSVTNDIERVIREMRSAGIDVDGTPIIYRDSDGRWDGVRTKGGEFYWFDPIGTTSEAEAADIARLRHKHLEDRSS
jgi:hypothetical protein